MNKIIRKLSEDRLIIFVCLFSAFLLWTSSQLAKNTKQTIEIKMNYLSFENKSLASDMPEIMEVVLEGSGWSLLFSDFKNQSSWDFYLPDEYDQIMTESDIIKKLRNDFDIEHLEVLSISPTHLLIKQDNLITKLVPIKADIKVKSTPEYIIINEPIITPSSIKLRGPQKMLERLEYWSIGKINIEQNNSNKNIRKIIQLNSGNKLLQLVPQELVIRAEFEELTEKTITIPITVDTLNMNIERIFPKEVKLKLRIGLSQFNNILAVDFQIGIDLDEIIQSNTYVIKIKKSPEDIQIVDISPAYVDVYFSDK